VRVFGGPFTPIADNVLAEWSVDPANPSRADPASRREILRIAQHRRDHGTDQLMFDPNARPGDADYGMLYFASGDGGRTEPGDQYAAGARR
jgi:hypothetical protein